jgi:DoxX-like family
MTERRTRTALTGLQRTLGFVVPTEAVLFVMPSAGHNFARIQMPDMVRRALGWDEIAGAALLLIPRTAVLGGWFLLGIFVLAIVVHLLHGTFKIGYLTIYTAAAWAIASGKTAARSVG